MKNVLMLATALILSTVLIAQRTTRYTLGPEVSIPTYREVPSMGFGGSASAEIWLKKKIFFTVDLGYNYFPGNVPHEFRDDTLSGFALVPLLIGFKYGIGKSFYVSPRAGATVGVKNSSTAIALSPALGFVLLKGNKPFLDIGAKMILVLPQASYPENAFVYKGGYSYLNLRIAFVL